MKHGKKTGCPPLLTEQEIASQLDAVASIRCGLAQARKGMGRPADEVCDDLEREDAYWSSLRGALKDVFAEKRDEAYLRAERSNFHPKKEHE